MIIRRYTGDSLEVVRGAIRRELGEGAVVINTRQYKKAGFLPGWGRTVFEATAVVEEAVDADASPLRPAPEGGWEPMLQRQQRQVEDLKRSIQHLTRKLTPSPGPGGDVRLPDDHPLFRDLHPRWRDRLFSELADPASLTLSGVRSAVARLIPTAGDLTAERGPPGRAFVLVGPTGVGKTTTLAKLAARAVFTDRREVGLITLDTYRIAGVDQLREYARLLGVELAVAFSETELRACLDRFRDKDLLFIDTPGRGPFDRSGIAELRAKLGEEMELRTLLLAPAAVRYQDAASIVEAYRRLNLSGLIVTKVDEATCCDGLSRWIDLAGAPVAYVTTGQQVPEDIEPACPDRLAALIVNPPPGAGDGNGSRSAGGGGTV